ncbi:MAG TPA: hypothetical protein VGN23_05735 [Verrucomicrobiae bacterium]|jgi:hypothetical protein
MKTKSKIAILMAATSIMAMPVLAGPGVGVQIQVGVPTPPPPVVVVPAPAPPTAVVVVPDSYAWDGNEYVGMVGDQYYYLGPGDMWVPMDQPHMARFHIWVGSHADWRSHAIVNEKYRYDAHHNYAPYKGDHHDHDMDQGDHGDHHGH